MKNIKMLLVVLCSTLLLVSCNYTRIGGHSWVGNTMSGKFDYCNGNYSKSVDVKEGETVSVTVELNVEEGEMYVVIDDKDGNQLFTTDENDTFEFTADSDTKLKATLCAEKAGGSYKISFNK